MGCIRIKINDLIKLFLNISDIFITEIDKNV